MTKKLEARPIPAWNPIINSLARITSSVGMGDAGHHSTGVFVLYHHGRKAKGLGHNPLSHTPGHIALPTVLRYISLQFGRSARIDDFQGDSAVGPRLCSLLHDFAMAQQDGPGQALLLQFVGCLLNHGILTLGKNDCGG